jgi:transposase
MIGYRKSILARFLVDVVDALDLGAIYDSYEEKDGRGQAAYDPAMMVRVLLYGYCTGSYSSRKIQAKTYRGCGVSVLGGRRTSRPQYAGGISPTASGGTGGAV